MSNFNYNNAKLLTVFSTQYQSNILTGTNLTKFVNTGANGYVLIPRSDSNHYCNITDLENIDFDNYDSGSFDSSICDIITPMAQFADNVHQINSEASFWIGLPQISANFDNNKLSYYSKVMLLYIWDAYFHFNSLWGNVKGFYYNQERFYNSSFNPNNPTNYSEFNLMQVVSNCVHNSNFDALPVKQFTVNKDLIWIPYIHSYSSTGEPNISEPADTIMEKEVNYIGKIAGNTSVFDCVCIQANLIQLYTSWGDVNGYTYPNGTSTRKALNKNRLERGQKNIEIIRKSAKFNRMVNESLNFITSPTSNCILGAEYELNGDREFSPLDNTTTLVFFSNKSLFQYYLRYNALLSSQPIILYWQATSNTSFNSVCTTIEMLYKFVSFFVNSFSVTNGSSVVSLCGAIISALFTNTFSSLSGASTQPNTSTIIISHDNTLVASLGEKFANGSKKTFMADNPEKFWIKDISHSITYSNNNEYVNQISYTFVPFTGLNSSHVTIFNNSINSILNNLGISISNLNNTPSLKFANEANKDNFTKHTGLRAMSSDFEKFHKIYNWLIDNVDGTDSGNDDYEEICDSAYGAISDNRLATIIGFTKALSVLCKAAGIPCIVANGIRNRYEYWWNYVKIDGNWWFVDIWESLWGNYRYKYFLRETPSSYHLSSDLPNIETGTGTYIKYGDVDDDGYITATDASMAYQKAINPNYNLNAKAMIAADATATGTITSEDSDAIMAKCLQETPLPVENYIKNVWT